MDNATPSTTAAPPNRRRFLKGLGVFGAAAAVSAQPALAHDASFSRQRGGPRRFRLFAEGTVTDFSLVWPAPQFPPLPDGMVLRVRIAYPVQPQGLLEFQTFLALTSALSNPVATVTLLHQRIDDILLSKTPAPNFGLFGQVIHNPEINGNNHSPWGDLTGRVQTIYGAFDEPGDQTTFTLLGGAAAGSHASALTNASGSLHFSGPWPTW